MSRTSTIGIVPKLLPITGTAALPFSIMATVLSLNVVQTRVATDTYYGRESKRPADSQASSQATGPDPLAMATAAQVNFMENAPLALLLCAVVELNGGSRKVLGGVMSAFVAARVAHAIGVAKAQPQGRIVGYFSSLLTILGLGGWAAWEVKSYWGF